MELMVGSEGQRLMNIAFISSGSSLGGPKTTLFWQLARLVKNGDRLSDKLRRLKSVNTLVSSVDSVVVNLSLTQS